MLTIYEVISNMFHVSNIFMLNVCGHLLAEVEVPSYEGSDQRLYFVAVVQDKSKLSEGQKKAINQTVHVFLHFGTFCLFLFKIILQISQTGSFIWHSYMHFAI